MIVNYASNNISVPEYLKNEQFFTNALEEGLREIKITIHEITFECGSKPGDNYCSSIYRVLVVFERFHTDRITKCCKMKEQISLIVKTIPTTPESRFLEDVGVFIKEKLTYRDVLSRLEILTNGEKFGASCFYAIKSPMQTIVFNDLQVDGFMLASRQDCLDWNHCELILQQLAKFHATSMVLAKKDLAIIEHFRKGMLSVEMIDRSETFLQLFGGTLQHLILTIEKWQGYEKIAEKLQRYLENLQKITVKFGMPKAGDRFTVLNHGDLWTTNFMFAYDDRATPQNPTRAIFIDFQLSFYGSPACDLNFFFNTSVQLDVLQHRRDELIDVYYGSLVATLDYLRHDQIPTLDDLKYELRSRELYGLFALYGFLPIVTMAKDLSKDTSIEAMINEDFKREKMLLVFANTKLQQHLKYSLKRFEDLGVLDELFL